MKKRKTYAEYRQEIVELQTKLAEEYSYTIKLDDDSMDRAVFWKWMDEEGNTYGKSSDELASIIEEIKDQDPELFRVVANRMPGARKELEEYVKSFYKEINDLENDIEHD